MDKHVTRRAHPLLGCLERLMSGTELLLERRSATLHCARGGRHCRLQSPRRILCLSASMRHKQAASRKAAHYRHIAGLWGRSLALVWLESCPYSDMGS